MKKKNILEYRVGSYILEDVCLDCADFLNHPCVECEACPVGRLKLRFKKKNRIFTNIKEESES
jgi:hypothetical protein